MKDYPFSGMDSARALEYLWLEFSAYKKQTDAKIASLQEQLNQFYQERNDIELSRAAQLREMLESPEERQARQAAYDEAIRNI